MSIQLGILTAPQQADLREYARFMARSIEPEIRNASFGGDHISEDEKRLARRINFARDSYARDFGIEGKHGCGEYRLQMVGANETPGSPYCDAGFWWILPLKSDNLPALDFLAGDALPRVFEGREFSVGSIYVPVSGPYDCVWDCR